LYSASLFALQDVYATRGHEAVFRDVSCEIPTGATAIVGPSGAGKSTLLRLLNRLADPQRGTILLRGRDIRLLDVLALRRDVALVPQLPALLPGTVEDNLRYAASLASRGLDARSVLERSGLDVSFATRDAARLSVGEQQRVMLARALSQEPSVLLLDEPTSALDAAAREIIERTLLRLRDRDGLSLILVTHDPHQAERLAQRTLRLDRGRLVAP
jgi:putative ABC transport system ATP-binding protein